MKYVQINMTCGVWADSIILKKHRELVAAGDESWFFWGRGEREQDEHLQRFGTRAGVYLDWLTTHLDGRPGFHSKYATRQLLRKLDAIDPDIVHLHVLTGYYINVEMLFNWLLHHSCKVIWTLHDCWDFTGHCIYFTYAKCNQWQTGCADTCACPQKREYPEHWFASDARVRKNYARKRELFTALPSERVQLITPSKWLAALVKQSYLGKYDVKVVNNTVNDDVFKPTPSDFRKRHGLESKFVVLGVASKWSDRKGLPDFLRLASDLDESKFAVVVVGLKDKQIVEVNSEAPNILAMPRTSTVKELVAIYTAADVLFNPTIEDNYPTVNLEAEACGTPVVTYNTGGCGETIELPSSCVAGSYSEGLSLITSMSMKRSI